MSTPPTATARTAPPTATRNVSIRTPADERRGEAALQGFTGFMAFAHKAPPTAVFNPLWETLEAEKPASLGLDLRVVFGKGDDAAKLRALEPPLFADKAMAGEIYMAAIAGDVGALDAALAPIVARLNELYPPRESGQEGEVADAGAEAGGEGEGAGGMAIATANTWSICDYRGDALSHAAALGSLECTRLLLAAGAMLVPPPFPRDPDAAAEKKTLGVDDQGDREHVIHRCVASPACSADVVQLLIDKGADVDARTRDGATPMHECAARGSVAAMRALMAAGADVVAADLNGETPLMVAAANGRAEMLEAMLKVIRSDAERGPDARGDAVAEGADGDAGGEEVAAADEAVSAAVRERGDHACKEALDMVDASGWRAIHHAASNDQVAVATLLADRGASLEPTTRGARPIDVLAPLQGGAARALLARLAIKQEAGETQKFETGLV